MSDKSTKVSESKAPFVIRINDTKYIDPAERIPEFESGISKNFKKITVSVLFGDRLKNPELKLNTSQQTAIEKMPDPSKKAKGTDIYDCLELFMKEEK